MERKLDTRHKIELGGLVVKAGLGNLPKAVILGLLVEAKGNIGNNTKILDHYQALGDIAFSKLD